MRGARPGDTVLRGKWSAYTGYIGNEESEGGDGGAGGGYMD